MRWKADREPSYVIRKTFIMWSFQITKFRRRGGDYASLLAATVIVATCGEKFCMSSFFQLRARRIRYPRKIRREVQLLASVSPAIRGAIGISLRPHARNIVHYSKILVKYIIRVLITCFNQKF